MTVIQTSGLSKRYKDKWAVDHLDLQVEQGDIYGFIGRNGAGKSTTLKLLCGLIRPTQGEATIFGKPIRDGVVRRRVGALIEQPGLYPDQSGRENLLLYATLRGLDSPERQVDEILETVGLSPKEKKPAKHYSMGMKQRLGVGLALLGGPDLLLLDEPINGLDPEGIRELRRLVLRLHETGKTILISSHILGELSKISTVYGIIKDGQMIEQITSEALEEKCMDYFQIEADDVSRALVLIGEAFPKVRAEVADSRLVRVYGLSEGAGLIRLLVEKQVQVYASGFHHMDLEEYFISRMEGGRADV